MFIIGKRVKTDLKLDEKDTSVVRLSDAPVKHATIGAARHEAQRLARISTDYEFLIFELKEGWETDQPPVKNNRYQGA